MHIEDQQNCARLEAECHKHNEIVATVETNLTCPICLNLFLNPYRFVLTMAISITFTNQISCSLSPCGHVLCLGCLREWFRTPSPDDDSDEDDDPIAILYRKKSCPVCRAEVCDRPVPAYVIKTIADAFEKVKPSCSHHGRFGSPTSNEPEDDPWSGLFPEAGCSRRYLSWD